MRDVGVHPWLTARGLFVGWFFTWISGLADPIIRWVQLLGRSKWDSVYRFAPTIRLHGLAADLTPWNGIDSPAFYQAKYRVVLLIGLAVLAVTDRYS